MNSPRVTALLRSVTWEFKPVLSYSKPHTFSTVFGEEENAFTLQKGPLEAEQNNRKVKKSKIKQK